MPLSPIEWKYLQSIEGTDYIEKVIARFQSGQATPQEWQEMAYAVLWMSENDKEEKVETIDRAIMLM